MSAAERFSLAGKKALVTGAAQGIGRGIATALAEHGANVAIVDKSPKPDVEKVADVIRGLGREARVYEQDLTLIQELDSLVGRIWEDMGGLDILVNNAGRAYLEHFNQVTYSTWRDVMSLNLDAVFFLTQSVAERMIAAGVRGRVINLSSNNGHVAEAGVSHYNASKGAIELLTQTLAIELGPHGITVNAIAPGVIQTGIDDDFDFDMAGFTPYCQEHIPLEGRLGEVEDCVGAAIFMASRAGSYMTGQSLVVDGGILSSQMPRLAFMPPYRNRFKQ